LASRTIVESFGAYRRQRWLGRGAAEVRRLTLETHRALIALAAPIGESLLGSTIVALLALGCHAACPWVQGHRGRGADRRGLRCGQE
jgi:hypothetical protein